MNKPLDRLVKEDLTNKHIREIFFRDMSDEECNRIRKKVLNQVNRLTNKKLA